MTFKELGQLLDKYAANEDINGALMLADRPDRWYDDPHWRCVNDHVNTNVKEGGGYVNKHDGSREFSYQICFDCGLPVRLTFPEDVSGPLAQPRELMT